MLVPQKLKNEANRLAALDRYSIVDTPLEQCFDEITRVAAHIMGTPIALVSLVDEKRQWFKSRYGLDIPETPRAISFCGHVVADDAAMTVSDARVDPRFEDNPLVCGPPNVVFYAGAPLRTPDGYVLGTLCALGSEPDTPTQAQLDALELLAAQVVRHLEARRERRRLEQYRRLFESPALLPIILDPSGIVLEHNQAWLALDTGGATDLTGTHILELVHPDDVEEVAAFLEQVRNEATVLGVQARVIGPHGERWLSWTAHMDDLEQCIYALARDVTAERELARQKRELLSMVSHDLRTPLTSISGSLKLLESGRVGSVDAQGSELVSIASNACDRLIRLVGLLLELDRLDSGRIDLQRCREPVHTLLSAAHDSVAGYAHDRGVHLDLPQTDLSLEADQDRIVQVLTNLLSNAIRHAPRGSEVRVEVERRSEGLQFSVIDRGPGIDEASQKRLFRRFSQVGAARTGGSGLGLAVCKGFVEAHGGSIEVHSTPGQGATFRFLLPDEGPHA